MTLVVWEQFCVLAGTGGERGCLRLSKNSTDNIVMPIYIYARYAIGKASELPRIRYSHIRPRPQHLCCYFSSEVPSRLAVGAPTDSGRAPRVCVHVSNVGMVLSYRSYAYL